MDSGNVVSLPGTAYKSLCHRKRAPGLMWEWVLLFISQHSHLYESEPSGFSPPWHSLPHAIRLEPPYYGGARRLPGSLPFMFEDKRHTALRVNREHLDHAMWEPVRRRQNLERVQAFLG